MELATAEAALRRRELHAASAAYQRLASLAPPSWESVDLAKELARLREEEGDVAGAKSVLLAEASRGAGLDNHCATAYDELSGLYERQGDLEGAVWALEQAALTFHDDTYANVCSERADGLKRRLQEQEDP